MDAGILMAYITECYDYVHLSVSIRVRY